MANITVLQIKRRAQKLADMLYNVRAEIEALQSETEEEAENIEPYGDKWELTPQQEERQEKLQDFADRLTEIAEELETQQYNLEEIAND